MHGTLIQLLKEDVVTPFSVKATIGYSVVVGIVSIVVQFLFIIVWAVASGLNGALFGYARLKTGALCLPLALHVVKNLIVVVPALIWGVGSCRFP